jgi:hypothetical protein
MPNLSNGLRQAYEVQDIAYDAIQALRETLKGDDGKMKVTRDDAQAIRNLATVWREAQERIAFHRRVPSPGSLRPVASRKARKRDASGDPFVSTIAPAPLASPVVYPPPGPGSAPAVMRDDERPTQDEALRACGITSR